MCISNSRSVLAARASHARRPVNLTWLYGPIIAALLLSLWPALAESPDDQYLRIYGIIEQADALATKGQSAPALAKYRQAQFELQNFQAEHRNWNPKLVSYRFNYLAQKVAALSEPAAEKKAAGASKATAMPSNVELKLLDAGAEPRKELRLHPKPGDKQTAQMTMSITLDTAIGEMPSQVIKMPPINMALEFTVQSVSEDGDITGKMVITDASVPDEPGALPQVVEPMKAALGAMKGLSGTGTMSSRGLSKGMEIKAPANADAQTRQVIEQMKEAFANLAVPLPQEAIGTGAKWEVKMPVKSQGATISQTATYELESLEDEHLTVKTTLAQRAANQKIQNAALPGLKLNLTRMVGTGTGSATADLTQLLPLERTADFHTEQSLTMDAGGQPQAMTIKTDMKLHSEAK